MFFRYFYWGLKLQIHVEGSLVHPYTNYEFCLKTQPFDLKGSSKQNTKFVDENDQWDSGKAKSEEEFIRTPDIKTKI